MRSTGRNTDVSGFSNELGSPIKVPIVDTIVAYYDPINGEMYLLIIKNALHVSFMLSNLIPPFLLHLAGVEIDKCPKFLSRKPNIKNHAIFFREEDIVIPLHLENTISGIPMRVPTSDELSLIRAKYIRLFLLTS